MRSGVPHRRWFLTNLTHGRVIDSAEPDLELRLAPARLSSPDMNHHLPQLDGLRGVAILIVLVGHLIVLNFGLGVTTLGPIPPLGVNLFFVLSGFLITRI